MSQAQAEVGIIPQWAADNISKNASIDLIVIKKIEKTFNKTKSLILSINDFDETILELIGNAQIESPSSTIKCNSIIYLVNRDLIREAAGPCEGALGAQKN